MIKEIGSFLTKFPQRMNPYLELLLKSYQYVLINQEYQSQPSEKKTQMWDNFSSQMASFETLYTEASMEICNHCALSFTENNFNLLKTHIQSNYSSMSQKSLTSLMESIAFVCSKQANSQTQKAALIDILQSPISFISGHKDSFTQGESPISLIKAITMLTGALKGLTEMDNNTLSEILMSLIQTVWPKLLTIMECNPMQKEVVSSICIFLNKVISSLSES